MSLNDKNSSLLITIKSHIKLFVIITLVAIVSSVIFSSSLFITPKYKSKASLYPSNLITYSSESPTEQLLQMLEGNDVRDSVVAKFNLVNHYKIDTLGDAYLYQLNKEYNDNILIGKTNYESVNIEVLDADPIIAKKIVEEIINQLNLKVRYLHRLKTKEVYKIRKDELEVKQSLIDSLEVEIKNVSTKYGLLDYNQQSREVTAGYVEMLLRGKKNEKLQKLFDNLTQKGSYFNDLLHQLNLARNDYNKTLILYDQAAADLKKKLTYTNTIVFPEVADKKSYPIRWLIVVLSVLGSFLFTLIILLINSRIKQL